MHTPSIYYILLRWAGRRIVLFLLFICIYIYKSSVIMSKRYTFPLLGFENEDQLFESELWEDVYSTLKRLRHFRCECCSKKSVTARPTKISCDLIRGKSPGFIAMVCEDHIISPTQKDGLVKALRANSFYMSLEKFWISRHKRGKLEAPILQEVLSSHFEDNH